MIMSNLHGFIFVKSAKTAGTSLEIMLSGACGPDDVITPLPEPDEELRRKLGHPGPQNTEMPLRGITVGELLNWIRGGRPHFFDHISARRIRRAIGSERWDAFFTMTIERNPWDKAVSRYFFRSSRQKQPPTFSTFLREIPRSRLSNWDLYAHNERILCDKVLRYESLSEELSSVWRELDLPGEPRMIRANSGFRPASTADYRTMYTDDDAEFVASVCAREIAAFGYTF